MIRTFELSATPIVPADPCKKLPVGPTDLRDPGGQGFVAEWLGHVAAGRIGGSPCGPTASLLEESVRPTASLREAEAMADEARAIVLANERVICGRQRSVIG